MAKRQALGIDINEHSRTGGDNFDLAKEYIQGGIYDFLIIKAGGGTSKGPIFDEQRKKAEKRGIPYVTYHFPIPGLDMKAQARSYVDWVGTDQPQYIFDIEKPRGGPRPPTKQEMRTIIGEFERLIGRQPMLYSRMGILQQIDFVDEARQYQLWMAQYPYNLSFLPSDKVQYRYFQDFLNHFSWSLPRDVRNTVLEDNTVLWQFSEKGNGPHYIYKEFTRDPEYPVGKKSADLNISIKGHDEFMKLMFGEVRAGKGKEGREERGEARRAKATYPDMINQNMIDFIYEAARPFTLDPWRDWIVRAHLEELAIPEENRVKPYTGPRIEDLPNLTKKEKAAILAVMNVPTRRILRSVPPYPGMTNQDMINLIYRAALPFTEDPWNDWIVRADLEELANPDENRSLIYTGPKIEDLPNLSDGEKAAILARM